LAPGTGTITKPMDAGSTEPVYRAPRPPRWPYVLAASFLITGLAVVLLWPVKLPYYAISPGPVEDVADLITVTDAQVYESEGKFYLLTVGLREVNAFEWFEARFLDPRVDLLDREVVRPRSQPERPVTSRPWWGRSTPHLRGPGTSAAT
jgi:hypothetical protein